MTRSARTVRNDMTLQTPTAILRRAYPMAVVRHITPFERTHRDVHARLEPGRACRWVRIYDSGHIRLLTDDEEQDKYQEGYS